jgi:D-alanyl-lipoteichoic acid acyltransferase DltB (MBOAT superfamily)
MLFNSFAFFLFFPIVTGLYFLLPHRARWSLLLTASCVFYMYFIPKYILILGFTIVVDYFAGLLIENARGNKRKLFLAWSIVANVGVLALFKYFNFLNANLAALAHFIGWNYSIQSLSLILPVGLSFHTFQAMSYTIEVYRGSQKAERHFGIYALYVMFYPQLVAGPIERPQNLLHQFYEVHSFDYNRVTNGLKLMAWGLFKKVVIADRLAHMVNVVYGDPTNHRGPVLVTATVFFAFQIFCDFSGYSDIAIGAARVMGFSLMNNFDSPYHARSIAEFWRRWHISLSTWFKDYLYIPLGGSRVSRPRWHLNIFIVFLVSGLWHGANWTYVIWGALHGLYLTVSVATQSARDRLMANLGQTTRTVVQVGCTFGLVCVSWVFFRAKTLHDAMFILGHLGTGWLSIAHPPALAAQFRHVGLGQPLVAVLGIALIEVVHLLRPRGGARALVNAQPAWLRWTLYYAGAASLLFYFADNGDQFIYFQF